MQCPDKSAPFTGVEDLRLLQVVANYDKENLLGKYRNWNIISTMLGMRHKSPLQLEERYRYLKFNKKGGVLVQKMSAEPNPDQPTESALGCTAPSYIWNALSFVAPHVSQLTLYSNDMWEYLVPQCVRAAMPFERFYQLFEKWWRPNHGKIVREDIRNDSRAKKAIRKQMADLRNTFGDQFSNENLQEFVKKGHHGPLKPVEPRKNPIEETRFYVKSALDFLAPYVSEETLISKSMWAYLLTESERKNLPYYRFLNYLNTLKRNNMPEGALGGDGKGRRRRATSTEIEEQMKTLVTKFGQQFNKEILEKLKGDTNSQMDKGVVSALNHETNSSAKNILHDPPRRCEQKPLATSTMSTPSGRTGTGYPGGGFKRARMAKERSKMTPVRRTRVFPSADPVQAVDAEAFRYEDATLKRYSIIDRSSLPKGYGMTLVGRVLKEIEWRAVLQYAYREGINLSALDESNWKNLAIDVGIRTESEGKEIMAQFYSRVLPNLKSLETHGQKTLLNITELNKYTFMSIYHGMEKVNCREALQVIDNLKAQGVLRTKWDSLSVRREFVKYVFKCSLDHAKDDIHTLPADLELVQKALWADIIDAL